MKLWSGIFQYDFNFTRILSRYNWMYSIHICYDNDLMQYPLYVIQCIWNAHHITGFRRRVDYMFTERSQQTAGEYIISASLSCIGTKSKTRYLLSGHKNRHPLTHRNIIIQTSNRYFRNVSDDMVLLHRRDKNAWYLFQRDGQSFKQNSSYYMETVFALLAFPLKRASIAELWRFLCW